jgi:hypothetical protein
MHHGIVYNTIIMKPKANLHMISPCGMSETNMGSERVELSPGGLKDRCAAINTTNPIGWPEGGS